ncbi:MAG: hypothetical protein KDD82_31655 [Planctomycetes bacterium]|nr:hypothetical protein [Planctomycetota bacterium]
MVLRLALALSALAALAHAEPTLHERVVALRPAREAWQRVGWLTDLSLARRKAAELQRPLFVWAMNGHPLGCT